MWDTAFEWEKDCATRMMWEWECALFHIEKFCLTNLALLSPLRYIFFPKSWKGMIFMEMAIYKNHESERTVKLTLSEHTPAHLNRAQIGNIWGHYFQGQCTRAWEATMVKDTLALKDILEVKSKGMVSLLLIQALDPRCGMGLLRLIVWAGIKLCLTFFWK